MNAAGSLTILRGTVGAVAGPALAGILIAAAGLPTAYGVDVLTFAVSLVALALMRATPPPPDAEGPSLRRVTEGLRYAWSRPDLLGTYAVDMVAMFFGMPEALFPAGVRTGRARRARATVLGARARLHGGLRNQRLDRSRPQARLGRHRGGNCMGPSPSSASASRLRCRSRSCAWRPPVRRMRSAAYSGWRSGTVPSPIRFVGRLASIELLSYTTGPLLGNAESGVVAALAGVRVSIVSGGLLCVAGCVICALLLPGFRAFDARDWTSSGGGVISKI